MKSSHLRIGNYYFVNGEPTLLTEEHILRILSGRVRSGPKQPVRPIKLTIHWLLRFGFEMQEDGNWRYADVELMQIGTTHWIDKRYRLLLRHVHELQEMVLLFQKTELQVRRNVDSFSLYDPVACDSTL